MEKLVYVKETHRGHETVWEGTIEYLKTRVFNYTLECGHSWDRKINADPKSLKSLIKALNESVYVCRRYDDSYSESTKEEFDAAEPMRRCPMRK